MRPCRLTRRHFHRMTITTHWGRPLRFLFVLCFAGFASSINLRLVDPMLPALAADFGVTLHEAALLASAYAFPYAIMQLILGPVGDAVGKSRLIGLSLLVLAGALAVSALSPNFTVALVGRALAGTFAGGIVPVAMALIGDRVGSADRQVAISRLMVATIIGQMTGAASAGLFATFLNWRIVFLISAAVAALAWLLIRINLPSVGEARRKFTFGHVFWSYRAVLGNESSLFVFTAVACDGALFFGLFPFVAPLLQQRGAAGPLEAGIAITAFGVGGVAYGGLVRRLLALLGPRWMMRAGGLVAAVSYAAIALPLHWEAVALLYFALGFGFYMVHNTLQALATERAPRARGSALALFSSCFFLGQGIGPIVGGTVAQQTGYEPLFVAAGILVAALGLGTAFFMSKATPNPPE
jgi:MFS transporter, DHA1 family, inner membrane transport protein